MSTSETTGTIGTAAAGSGGGGSLLLSQPIVIDNGTATIKSGFAGSSKPKVVLGTKVGRTKHMRIMPGGALESSSDESNKISSIFVGQKLDEHRGAFYLEYPMDKGMITESGWNAMTRLWEVSSWITLEYSHVL